MKPQRSDVDKTIARATYRTGVDLVDCEGCGHGTRSATGWCPKCVPADFVPRDDFDDEPPSSRRAAAHYRDVSVDPDTEARWS